MLSSWQARGRVAVIAVSAVLLAVQASLLVSRHDVMVGLALILAGAHVVCLPLALRRPLPAAGLSVLALVAQALVMMPQGVEGWPLSVPPQVITQLVVLLVLTLVSGWRLAAATLAAALVAGLVLSVAGMKWNDVDASIGFVVLFAALALLFGAFGAVVVGLARTRESLTEQRRISAEEHARRTLVEEKSRIARELHDVIAHNMSLITVQARSAPHRVANVSEQAAAEFGEIADRAAEALRQMRGVLDVMRTEPGQAGRMPVPGLEDLDELIESARATGQRIEVDGVPPSPERLAPEVGSAAYRIVQEALSNARRHAAAEEVRIRFAADDDGLDLRIANALTSAVPGPEGHGLMGMRERALAVGGTVASGPAPETRAEEFVVAARLPLRAADRKTTDQSGAVT